MDSGTDVDGFLPAESGRAIKADALKPNPPLVGVVRISRTTQWQIQVRIAEDIVRTLGWEDDAEICVLIGHGKLVGKVRLLLASNPRAPTDGHRARLYRLGNARARTVTIPASVLGITSKFSVFTAPHEIGAASDALTIDLGSIL